MTFKNQNRLLQKVVILSLSFSFTLFGMQESKNIFHSFQSVTNAHNKIGQQSNSCCKECNNENCTCCPKHEEKNTRNSDNCTCRRSKDMDEGPLQATGNLKIPDYHLFQTSAVLLIPLSKNLPLLKAEPFSEFYISLKQKHSTVLLI